MSPTRAEQAEKTRQAVLDTARKLSLEHDATSLQLIADTMGVTKANVYRRHHRGSTKGRVAADRAVPAKSDVEATYQPCRPATTPAGSAPRNNGVNGASNR